MNLSDLIVSEGFEFLIDAQPGLLPAAMGKSDPGYCCAHYLGPGEFAIVCDTDSIRHAYSASHEIAELKHDFKHSVEMFCSQANILARWCKLMGGEVDE